MGTGTSHLIHMVTAGLVEAVAFAGAQGYHGLLYQHIDLCPTRTWLHFQRVDCAHLNRYMQHGMVVHQTAYRGQLDRMWGMGIRPDAVDFEHHLVSEVKSSRSFADASHLQLGFYLAVLTVATHVLWEGRLRYPSQRKVTPVVLTPHLQADVVAATDRIYQTVSQSLPPNKVLKPLCTACSYRLLCWGLSTEDLE